METFSSVSVQEKKVLIYFFGFRHVLGGGEYLPLLLMREFQKRGCSVTLAVNWETDMEQVNRTWHMDLDVQKIKVVYIGPKNKFLWRFDYTRPFYRVRRLKKLAKDADILISVSNPFDFGKPAHHFICSLGMSWDSGFKNYIRHIPSPKGFAFFKKRIRAFLAETFFRPLLGFRSTRKILADPREHIYPTSNYVDAVMRGYFGPFTGTVFYPPTLFEAKLKDVKRNPLQINYIGRIDKAKRIDDVIKIVELARNTTGLDIQLLLAGDKEHTSYAESIEQTYAEKKWIRFIGRVYGEEKERFLLSGTYAVHAMREEAFGISITEYLKAGCIPLVPDEGGTVEIVDSPALTYHTNEEAASILVKLLRDEDFHKEQLAHCMERAKAFSTEAYFEKQRLLLDKILSES